MRKIDYFVPRRAVVITGVAFVSLCIFEIILEMLGMRAPGYEWIFTAYACAFAASVLWFIGCILLNAWNDWRSKT
jgi:hypothetical protein